MLSPLPHDVLQTVADFMGTATCVRDCVRIYAITTLVLCVLVMGEKQQKKKALAKHPLGLGS